MIEPMSLRQLKKMKKELLLQKQKVDCLTNQIEELKKEPSVLSYIKASNELNNAQSKIEELNDEIKYQNMIYCNHYYVLHSYDSGYDGHRYEPIWKVTCIHCGLTNRYYGMDIYDEKYAMLNYLFSKYGRFNPLECHGKFQVSEISDLKQIYDDYVKQYPKATDKEIEDQIALVKKKNRQRREDDYDAK